MEAGTYIFLENCLGMVETGGASSDNTETYCDSFSIFLAQIFSRSLKYCFEITQKIPFSQVFPFTFRSPHKLKLVSHSHCSQPYEKLTLFLENFP